MGNSISDHKERKISIILNASDSLMIFHLTPGGIGWGLYGVSSNAYNPMRDTLYSIYTSARTRRSVGHTM